MPAESIEALSLVTVGGGGNLPATNELPVDMHHKVLEAFPQLTPVTAILTRLGQDPAFNFRVDWQEAAKMPVKVRVGTDLAAGGTSLVVVENGESLIVDTQLYNPRTFDQAGVDTTSTTNTVTITRATGGTTAAAWVSGDILYVMPPAVAEDQHQVNRFASAADTNVFNFLQLVRMEFAITRTMANTKTHFGFTKRQSLQQQKFREVREKWELLTYFGGRSTGGTAPATVRMSGGFVHFLRNGTLYKDFNGIMTETGFRKWLGDYKDQNPDATDVMLFLAGNAYDIIGDFGLGKVRLTPDSKKYGLDVMRYKARGLNVDLINLPLLTEGVARGWGFLIDLQRTRMRIMRGGNLTLFPDAYGVGQSERIQDLYRVQTSLLLGNESRHAMFVGALN